MGALMRIKDWTRSPLGPPEKWPQTLRTALRLLLTSRHPMFIWWGPRLVQFYNDAYRQSIGPERHPSALGQEGRQCWDEIWHIIGPQIEQVMSARGATWQENALVPITRNGVLEDVYWTYGYGPIDDPTAATGVGGVMVICTETTREVLAAKRLQAERDQLADLFAQTPSFMAMVSGPQHTFMRVNAAYRRLVGDRDLVGKTAAAALPNSVAQGYIELLDRVYSSGEPFTAYGAKYLAQAVDGGPTSERIIDFVYQPIKDASGAVTGIFVEGFDITERQTQAPAYRALLERVEQLEAQLAKSTAKAEE
jgi:PAS domain-containing protein